MLSGVEDTEGLCLSSEFLAIQKFISLPNKCQGGRIVFRGRRLAMAIYALSYKGQLDPKRKHAPIFCPVLRMLKSYRTPFQRIQIKGEKSTPLPFLLQLQLLENWTHILQVTAVFFVRHTCVRTHTHVHCGITFSSLLGRVWDFLIFSHSDTSK